MHYYTHNIGEHLLETAHLSFLQDGVYRRLKDRYFATEKPLPADILEIFRLVRCATREEKKTVENILSEFFTLTELGWTHKKCDAEIASYQVKAEANQQNGAKGGRPKKKTENKPSENPVGLVSVSKNNPNETLFVNQEPLLKEPHTPQAGRTIKAATALKTYLDACKAESKKPIPETDTVFDYANEAGIDRDFLGLHWLEFKDRYSEPGAKRYKDWPTVFRKSVRGNWFRLWYAVDGGYALTTTGQQAKKIHDGRKAA